MQNFVVIVEKMPEISAIENLCSPKMWAKVHQNCFIPATSETSHHTKFHRDRPNQLGEKHYKNWASDKKNFCHGRTETWLLKLQLAACERRD